MNNNNWHVPLSEFSDEQRKVIERVYRPTPEQYFLVSDHDGVIFYESFTTGKEITPDEAFKILGLDRLLEPEQGLQDVDWPNDSKYIIQNGVCLEFTGTSTQPAGWKVIATRPKAKVKPLTDEQIEAVREYDEFLDRHANDFEINLIEAFFKEREQAGGEL